MKDGYYLSTYLHIDELSHLLEMTKRHDQNLSLYKKEGSKVELIHHWELERVSGMKGHSISFYDADQAKEVINSLLMEHNLAIDDMVEVWGTPGIQTSNDYHSLDEYPDYTYHGISHLFSAIMLDTDMFNDGKIVGLAVDGGPDSVVDVNAWDKKIYVGCVVDKGKMELFKIQSPGALWFLSRYHFGLREGTLMALASATQSECDVAIEYERPIEGYDDIMALNKWYEGILEKLSHLDEEEEMKENFDSDFSKEDNKISMVMKKIQKLSVKIMDETMDQIIKNHNVDTSKAYLAISGGYALNCPSNSHLMSKYKFKGFMAPPCVNDGGMSIGMALYAFYKKMGKFDFRFENSYYGDADDGLKDLLEAERYKQYIRSVHDLDYDQIVEDIQDSPIVWFNGRAEIGPRALGNRSIIADPRTIRSKDVLNVIKKRQWWRPVAPIVLEEKLCEWFDDAYPSPYMLHTFNIKKERQESVPAVSHLDTSARVQTVSFKDNPMLYGVIRSFEKNCNIPMLCNTSLNDAGEPIINKVEEAVNFALRKGIQVMYVNGSRVELCNHDAYKEGRPHQRPVKTSKLEDEAKEEQLKKMNPHNLPREMMLAYCNVHELYSRYGLQTKEDVETIKSVIQFLIEKGKLSFDMFNFDL